VWCPPAEDNNENDDMPFPPSGEEVTPPADKVAPPAVGEDPTACRSS
jgi:hypothetical protein